MEDVRCNYCGSDDTRLVNEGADLLLNKSGNFRLVQCLVCDLIYQNPRLSNDELALYYPDSYVSYRKKKEDQTVVERVGANHAIQRQCARLIRHRTTPGRLLDIGCATGVFLHAMQEKGWEVHGVEPSEHAVAYAREQYELTTITHGVLADTRFPDGSFDVVTLWDVLEHVADPKAVLNEVYRILKPAGLLVISVPNPTSLDAYLFGSYWLGWERPRHLHLFPPKLLEKYLNDASFSLQSIESFSGRWGVTLFSLRFFFVAQGWSPTWWEPLLKLLYTLPFRAITWPFYQLLERLNRTTVMAVFSEKVVPPN